MYFNQLVFQLLFWSIFWIIINLNTISRSSPTCFVNLLPWKNNEKLSIYYCVKVFKDLKKTNNNYKKKQTNFTLHFVKPIARSFWIWLWYQPADLETITYHRTPTFNSTQYNLTSSYHANFSSDPLTISDSWTGHLITRNNN